jgi:putative FmdB family regulatory protein
MPMYDFECKGCGHTFETVAKLDDKPECPSCKSTDTERLMGAPSLGKQAALNFSLGNPKQRGGRPKSG